jgi:hypothetical protein
MGREKVRKPRRTRPVERVSLPVEEDPPGLIGSIAGGRQVPVQTRRMAEPADIRRAVAKRDRAEAELTEVIEAARAAGLSWAVIGRSLGCTAEAARARHHRATS